MKVRKISDNQKILNKFLIINAKENSNFFGREGALAKKLIIQYGIEFLLWVPLPDNKKIQTLLWLSCKEGHNYLKAFLLDFHKEKTDFSSKNSEINLSKTKIGQDILINKEPRTLIEFLRKY